MICSKIFALFLFFINTSASITDLALYNQKFITPEFHHDTYAFPGNFNNSSNLRRITGSSFFAKGELLYLRGKIIDIFEQPVAGAIVKIWHANYLGFYNKIAKNEDEIDIDFAENGTAITDENGIYSFITIFPGHFGQSAPHVHFLISAKGFQDLETKMFFRGHPRNKIDKKYNLLKNKDLSTCQIASIDDKESQNGKMAVFNIMLNGILPFGDY